MKIKLLGLFVLAFVCVFSLTFFIWNLPKRAIVEDKPLSKEFSENEWMAYFLRKGSSKAYLDFKEEFKNKPSFLQHSVIHKIGSILYELNGLGGLSICDKSYAYGCYHGFFARAISERGIGEASSMNEYCLTLSQGVKINCQHGLGHGIMAYYGGGELVKSLDMCSKFEGDRSDIRCMNGVFMEFNFNTMSHSETVIRKLDPSKPYYPCNELQSEYRATCYYSQTEWWNQVYDKNYEKIGKLCKGINDLDERSMCYLGAGWSAAFSSSFEPLRTITKCDQISDSVGEFNCKKGATTTFKLNANELNLSEEDIKLICNSLSKAEFSKCYE